MAAERRYERSTRRGVFHIWVGLAIAFALALGLALPFLQGEPFAFLAGVPVIALNLVLLGLALGWLIWYALLPQLRDFFSSDERWPGRTNR